MKEIFNLAMDYSFGSFNFRVSKYFYPVDYTWALNGYNHWESKDNNGIPVVDNLNSIYNPSAVIGYAFANLQSKNNDLENLDKLLRRIDGILDANLDKNFGLFTVQSLAGITGKWYSILYQGLYISFCCILLDIIKDSDSSLNNLKLKLLSLVDFVRIHGRDVGIIELDSIGLRLKEFPGNNSNEILNGALVYAVALVQAKKYLLPDQRKHYDIVHNSVIELIKKCDTGDWSLYESNSCNYSTPSYHNLHIGLLQFLYQNEEKYNSLEETLNNWIMGSFSFFKRTKALRFKLQWKIKKKLL